MVVVEVTQRYQAELKTAAQSLQRQTIETVESVQMLVKDWSSIVRQKTGKMQAFIAEVKAQAADQSPIKDDDNHFVCETFLWLAVCSIALIVGNTIGNIISFTLGIILGPIETLLLIYIVLPALLHHSKPSTELNDELRRVNSVSLSLFIGILVGLELSGLKLSFSVPPAFIIYLSIGFTAGALRCNNRLQLISTTLGGSMTIYTIWAFVVGAGISFLFCALVLCTMAAVDLQLKIAQHRSGSHDIVKHQLQTIIGYVIIQSALTLVFGK